MGKSIDGIGRRREPPPLLILSMSLQPVIPWRGALQQSPTPLHRPRPASLKTRLSASQKTSNGKGAQLKLSQLRGSPHYILWRIEHSQAEARREQPLHRSVDLALAHQLVFECLIKCRELR